MKQLIVTSDDFGAAVEVNEAVETAHRQGILTAASLMVAAPAAADAVARAKTMPGLGVGLHLVLVEGTPMLAPENLPDLVDASGRFRTDMAAMGWAIFARPKVRQQLAAEITAQFEAFAATGLPLDHVNAHKHYHLHPTIAGLVLKIGARFGMRAMRAPVEPLAVLERVEPVRHDVTARIAGLWARRLRGKLRSRGIRVPDQVFGLAWSGGMTGERVAVLIENLPTGVTEIYSHPATTDDHLGHYPGYRYADEFAALIDQAASTAVRKSGATLCRFADLA